jgi:methyl-accepting chemotaxis protein
MEEARKNAVQNARAIAEQATVAKELEAGIREVSRLSSEITIATAEQSTGVTSLVKDAEEVRRIAKQTARVVGEQAEALGELATSASVQTRTHQGHVNTTAEQATTTTHLTETMRSIRIRTVDMKSALASQAASVATTLDDIATVTREAASLRASTTEQVGLLADVAMTGSRPGEG